MTNSNAPSFTSSNTNGGRSKIAAPPAGQAGEPSTSQQPVNKDPSQANSRQNPGDNSELDPPNQPNHLPLRPITPKYIKRWNRPKMRTSELDQKRVRLIPSNMFEGNQNLVDWELRIHPGGARYFTLPGKKTMSMTTEHDVSDPKMAGLLHACRQEIIRHDGTPKGGTIELVLEIIHSRTGINECGYYLVNHETRLVFWPCDVEIGDLFGDIKLASDSHVVSMLQSEYWRHSSLFPNSDLVVLTTVDLRRLRDLISHARTEFIISSSPLSPFDLGHLSVMREICADIRVHPKGTRKSVFDDTFTESIYTFASFMQIFTFSMVLNYRGHDGARLAARQLLFEEEMNTPKSILFASTRVILMGSDIHKHGLALRQVWVNDPEMMVVPRWKSLIADLNKTWRRFTAYAIVMLSVTVGTLGIQDTPALSLVFVRLSAVFAITCIAISLFLVGAVNDRERIVPEGPVSFLMKMRASVFGLPTLAIMHSLPFPLLTWGMIWYIISLFIMILSSGNVLTRIIGGSLFGILMLCSVFCGLQMHGIFGLH